MSDKGTLVTTYLPIHAIVSAINFTIKLWTKLSMITDAARYRYTPTKKEASISAYPFLLLKKYTNKQNFISCGAG